ncbi:tyrosine-protein phosphatase non-receptor type 2-like isoform X2 [Pomacea canaliculata]|uniref:tyrosine-protein phosphatase non-receptor type 2-like isoform X2 n=2 Tax=Pomacea canaliculata TaxID=400727 RepID=UPI000D725FC0|nr:tyrosine-protein phosphatase non-receptor type 2-like isoform X2 [Pomacea canaliculata]
MLSQIEREFQEYDDHKSWVEIFKRLKNLSTTVMDETCSVSHARSPENRPKNRYRDVSPYDHSRVILERPDGESDYINASFVRVPDADRKYILTQGPLENTCGDFWLMIWQQQTKAIVMLNRVVEKGTAKCAQYWPLGSDLGYEDSMLFEDVGLIVTLIGEQDSTNFVQRWFTVEELATGIKREVVHFNYTTWPDFGVPSSPTAFLNFLKVVRAAGVLDPDVGPCVVHCSAGIGRSGTFCLVDSCLVLIEKHKTLSCLNIQELLINMRSYRMGLIQTHDQLRFSYLAILQGGREILGEDANSNIKTSDSPPPPPKRGASLPVSNSNEEEKVDSEEDDIDKQLSELIDDDDEAPPELPPKKRITTKKDTDMTHVEQEEEEEESSYLLRKRIREERVKKTRETLNQMKERQRRSESWKKRHSYFRPVYIGLALLIGSYMFYRFYWSN